MLLKTFFRNQYAYQAKSYKTAYTSLSSFGTIKPFVLPDLGEKIKEATIKKWHVSVGDVVEEYQPLADVATDKLFTQIPASDSGKIHRLLYEEEDNCQVGDVLLEIDVEGDGASAPSAGGASTTTQTATASTSSSSQSSTATQQQSKASSGEGKLATPAVRAMVREHNLNLNDIVGTGKAGRVMKEDVLAFLKGGKQPAQQQSQSTTSAPQQAAQKESTPSKTINVRSSIGANAPISKEQVVMSDFQKGMQKSMSEALTIPHFYYKDEFDMTNLAQFREKVKNEFKTKITFMPFFIKTVSLALNQYPIINSLYLKENQYEYTKVDNHNISFAIDSPKGLVVPNVKNCQDKSIFEINDDFTRILDDAKRGVLGPKDLMDGTFSISNIGNIGGTYLGPIILPPQVCIVALGKSQLLPRYIQNAQGQNELAPRSIMNVSFGCDHRVLDGATVARFSQVWKSVIENPDLMALYMK